MEAILKEIEHLTFARNDEKRPFDTKYRACELIAKTLEDQLSACDRYILHSLAARLCFDTLEMHRCRENLKACEQMVDPLQTPVDGILSFVEENPCALPFVLRAFNTRSLVLGNSDALQEARAIWLKTEALRAALEAGKLQDKRQETQGLYEYSTETYSEPGLQEQLIHAAFFAAQVLQKLGEKRAAAECCERTLQYQRSVGTYDRFEMLRNAVDLTHYYSREGRFSKAFGLFRYAADLLSEVLQKLKPSHQKPSKFIQNDPQDLSAQGATTEVEELVLDLSEDGLLQSLQDGDRETVYNYIRELGSFYVLVLEQLRTRGVQPTTEDNDLQLSELLEALDKPETTPRVSIQFILQLTEQAEEKLKRALKFFLLDGFTTAHVEIQLERAHLLSLQTGFCPFEQISLHKRRIQLLERFPRELNPQHYAGLIEETLETLSDARYEIFDCSYRKMLQKDARFEQVAHQLTRQDMIEVQRICAYAASAIEQLQTQITAVETHAQTKCRCQENLQHGTAVPWERWIKYVAEDTLEIYVDAAFKQAVIFSKFPARDISTRRQMMERAAEGFTYCEKLWNWIQAHGQDCAESLQLVKEMLTLMRVRISQMQ